MGNSATGETVPEKERTKFDIRRFGISIRRAEDIN
jgi:hypothetical protein